MSNKELHEWLKSLSENNIKKYGFVTSQGLVTAKKNRK